ncbi:hypothetical protein DPMN_183592 [Dreissena polymorpha]|uniref:Uncharacterized protein n=1 Tax=Dreissena polymorpha TaxID=45954 RepID=A0A9D4DHV2_DREPO|nr:hypothetical protein DPMN_183592 [Dreissena polymorpha]
MNLEKTGNEHKCPGPFHKRLQHIGEPRHRTLLVHRWLYVLVPLLCREAETVDLTIRLVSEHALTRVSRKIFKEVHGRLFEIWEKYEDDDMTTTQLLRTRSHIIGLGPIEHNPGQHRHMSEKLDELEERAQMHRPSCTSTKETWCQQQ